MDHPKLIGTVLDLAGLHVLHGFGHLERDGAGFGVRHETARTEDAAELTHDSHHVGRGDGGVEVEHATLHQGGQVFRAYDVGAGGFRLRGFLTLGEHGHTDGLAGAVREHDGAAHLLIGVPRVDTKLDVDFDGLVEISGLEAFQQFCCFDRGVDLTRLDGLLGFLEAL